MPADASIYQNFLRAPKSIQDYDNEAMQAQTNALGLQQQRMQVNALAQQQQEDQSLRNYLASGAKLDTPDGQAGLYRVAPKAAGGILKTQAELAKEKAQTGLYGAQTDEAKQKTDKGGYEFRLQKANDAIKDISSFSTPDQARQSLIAHAKAGDIDNAKAQMLLQQIKDDPTQFAEWRKGMVIRILDAKTQLEMTAPKPTEVRLGDRVTMIDTNPNSPTYKQEVTSAKVGLSPDTVYTQGQENARSAESRNVQLQVAGVGPGGKLDDNAERTAQAIASGQLPAPTGMALLNPKNQRVLGRVMEINPQYDSTAVDAKKKAARDFTSGTLGNSMRSFAVAGQHLDQLGQLVDALDNGNMQVVNKVGNYIKEQTGNPAPTNFDAAKDIVGKEVIKAIVAGGGGVSERQELQQQLSNAKSPAQLKGVISQYRSLMSAQHDALLTQRRSAGLPDSTLPDYTKPDVALSSGVPGDIAAILQKHGGK